MKYPPVTPPKQRDWISFQHISEELHKGLGETFEFNLDCIFETIENKVCV